MTDITDKKPARRWPRRVAWLVAIWAASIAVLAVVSYVLRILMNAAGLTA
ncbi:DUF2474 domain-containing protein [Allopusillimonas ginsengisoli]|nr:DUF2474 domain-containing protein [Allopusillimonas ginsengisoli]TEA77604.1 DUF2474 family protein [Allopusillimonas ginsengisoli]